MISSRDSRPAPRPETCRYTSAVVNAIESAAAGTGGDVTATTAAVEVASSTWARALSLATVESQTRRTAAIRRLLYGEHWKVGTIAVQLGLHRETVRAAVERETGGVRPSLCRPSILDPYPPFIRDTAQCPRLRATRIHEMVRQRGYTGSIFPVRRLVRRLRPESGRAVYRRVLTLVGE